MSGFLGQGPIFILSLVFVLGLVVVIHELGHYLAGRAFGAAAESFSVGFGRSLIEWKDKRNTRWRINWIPLGGFVKFVGEGQLPGDVGKIETGPVGKKYMDLTVGQRSIVSVAGPLANFVLAIAIFAILALVHGETLERVTIVEVVAEPALSAGFEAGDIVLTIDGQDIQRQHDLKRKISLSTGDILAFVVERAGQKIEIDVVPERMELDNGFGQITRVGGIGVATLPQTVGHVSYTPSGALAQGVRQTGDVIALTGRMLGRMVTGREPLNQLSGPVGIGDLTRRAVTSTLELEQVPISTRLAAVGWTVLQISAFVSVGIGLFNLLPFPVLDGGHLVFNAYEAVTGSVLPEKIQELSLTFGAVLLLSMAVLVTLSDIVRTGVFQSFVG